MVSNMFSCQEIFRVFGFEWESFLLLNNNIDWAEFVERKDLGIRAKDDKRYGVVLYEITDEKKWLFTKLKYGI